MKGEDVIKKAWNKVVWLFFMMISILVAVFTVPRLCGIQTFVVTSASMEPEYPVGSMIYVTSINPEEILVGDEITFYMEDTQIVATHQVYQIDENNRLFFTQGINNRDKDGNILKDALPVQFDSLIGKTVFCVPYLGMVNRFCTTAPGNYVIVGAAVIIAGISLIDEKIPKVKNNKMFRRKSKNETEKME